MPGILFDCTCAVGRMKLGVSTNGGDRLGVDGLLSLYFRGYVIWVSENVLVSIDEAV